MAEKNQKKRKKNIAFGWDVFNDDTMYKAHFKRTKKLEKLNNKELTMQER